MAEIPYWQKGLASDPAGKGGGDRAAHPWLRGEQKEQVKSNEVAPSTSAAGMAKGTAPTSGRKSFGVSEGD